MLGEMFILVRLERFITISRDNDVLEFFGNLLLESGVSWSETIDKVIVADSSIIISIQTTHQTVQSLLCWDKIVLGEESSERNCVNIPC